MKHLTYSDRLKIETLYKTKKSISYIANYLNVHNSTIYRELKKGYYKKLNSDYTDTVLYSADIAQKHTSYMQTSKGANLKLSNDYAFVQFLENKIKYDKYSPKAVLYYIEQNNLKFKTKICYKTIYNYISNGVLNITRKDLPMPRKHKYKKIHKNYNTRNPLFLSIEQRPQNINNRDNYGHWEMDTVVGTKSKSNVLLVLTERKSRYEIILKMKDKTSNSVVSALNKLERRYKKDFKNIFKSITVDNGVEFSNIYGMQHSCLNNNQRTIIYYCHPYTSCERGSNENQNKMIRRFCPKGQSLNKYTDKQINDIQHWLNSYPRQIFNGENSYQQVTSVFVQLAENQK